jgi:cation:H+ antiporter
MVSGGPAVQVGIIAVTVVGLWVGARLLVDSVVRLARRFGRSELTIGLTIVAMGTSTPELAVSVDAAFKGLGDIAVANVLGSNIYNITGILGIAALVRPLAVTGNALETVAWLGAVSVLVVAALWTGRVLSRLEGVLLAASEALRWALGLLGKIG